MVRKTLYEVETANQALPLVRSIVRDVVEEFHTLRTSARMQRTLQARLHPDARTLTSLRRTADQVDECSARIERYLRELEDLGLELRDLETGLVDFPTLRGGEPAYLCWKPGEETIAWWHAASQGFTDRRPLEQATSIPLPLPKRRIETPTRPPGLA